MNANLLAEILQDLRALEKRYKIGELLDDFVVRLGGLIGSPSDVNVQKQYSNSFQALKKALADAEAEIPPQRKATLEDLDLADWFSVELADRLAKTISSNSVTLSIANDETTRVANERKAVISNIRATATGLGLMNVVPPINQTKAPEIGFTIPRELFDNDVDGLIKELRQLSMIIHTFASIHGEGSEPIRVQTISTSDPVFWLAITWLTCRELGKGIKWGLDTLLVFEQVKQARASAEMTGVYSEEQLEAFFDKKVKDGIRSAIEKKAAELAASSSEKPKKVVQNRLEQALSSLVARLERGLRAELRLPPPPPAEAEAEQAGDDGIKLADVYQELKVLETQLKFPKEPAAPILALEYHAESDDQPSEDGEATSSDRRTKPKPATKA